MAADPTRPDHRPDSVLRDLDAALATGQADAKLFRDALEAGTSRLAERFRAGESVRTLVSDRAVLVDEVLVRAWRAHASELTDRAALVAVGGYGRGELHPRSDVDVLVLVADEGVDSNPDALERFVTFLWDIGLEIGHSVRSIGDCSQVASDDVTVATTLMEARCLAGREDLFARMQAAVGPDRVWPADRFFAAKLKEQSLRHQRYHDTAHNLEPNLKSSPGGLRDIQMIGWVARRYFGVDRLEKLVEHGFLTGEEFAELNEGRDFLWRVRFALHTLTGRREDRLLFDFQIALAHELGFEDREQQSPVEQLMQQYYRTVMQLKLLNEMLLQLLRESILCDPDEPQTTINDSFHIRHNVLAVNDTDVFQTRPGNILSAFRFLQEYEDLDGFSGITLRCLRGALNRIDDGFRGGTDNNQEFLRILRAGRRVTRALTRMNEYGVLGRYIPAFGLITGRMQYDMFHAYTVDVHTIFVISNLRRFALTRFDHEFPYCSEIMQSLPKPELAYLAALFHDIAKGRRGDHSTLGADEARLFCLGHGLSDYDADLVAWLVQHHLLLSLTAQKQDISDPEVIRKFAAIVEDQIRLDYLYVLTVADVRGTNPRLWNSWKAALFEDLYRSTLSALQRGLEHPVDRRELVSEIQATARAAVDETDVNAASVAEIWQKLPQEYFLRHSVAEVVWHIGLLAGHKSREHTPLVGVRHHPARGGTSVLVYAPRGRDAFARATAALDELGLNILDARITPTTHGHSLDTYHVLEDTGAAISERTRVAEIEQRLTRVMQTRGPAGFAVTRRAPRQVRLFTVPPRVEFAEAPDGDSTIMELVAGDRPGLLSDLGTALVSEHVDLYAARIMTVGERAEDVLTLSKPPGRPLTSTECDKLGQAILARLDKPAN